MITGKDPEISVHTDFQEKADGSPGHFIMATSYE